MDITLGEHIQRLERRLEALNEEIMRPGMSIKERNQLESDIRAVNLALDHYRAALELEHRVAH